MVGYMIPNSILGSLHYGENLTTMQTFDSKSVDLVYLDPPYNTGRTVMASASSFSDKWKWNSDTDLDDLEYADIILTIKRIYGDSTGAYLLFIALRIQECVRLLKETGSLYLQCDTRADHQIRLILDSMMTYQGSIIWRRTRNKGNTKKIFAKNYDVILYYTKSDRYTWNAQLRELDEEYLTKTYRYVEQETGRRYASISLKNPNADRPNLTYDWNGYLRTWRWTKDRMQKAHDDCKLIYSSSGLARQKAYLDETSGIPYDLLWTDIENMKVGSERTGYPTQKPEVLLKRIIQTSSNPGDTVLDAFCGSGTACYVAKRLGRHYIGIDSNEDAIRIAGERLL